MRLSIGLMLVALIVGVVIFNGFNLTEAYGSGEPYYSRTTNMDKWTDPLPALYTTDVVTAVLTVGYLVWTRRRD
jgi:hypothetical protein